MTTRQTNDSPTIIEPEFFVYPSKNIIPIYGVLSLLALGFAVYSAISLAASPAISSLIPLGIATMAFFYYLRKIRVLSPTDQPFFTLNKEGIEIRSTGLVPWSIIRRAYIKTRVNKYRYLVIEYKSQVASKQAPLEYFLERRYFDQNYDQLKHQLELYAQKYIVQ